MADLINSLDGGVHGAVATAESTAYSGGTQIVFGGTSTTPLNWDHEAGVTGSKSLKMQPVPAGKNQYLELTAPASTTSASFVGHVNITAHPDVTDQVLAEITDTAGNALLSLDVSPTATVTFRSNGQTVGGAPTNGMGSSTWFRLELAVKIGAAGQSLVAGKVTNVGTGEVIHQLNSTTLNLSGRTIAAARMGFVRAGAASNSMESHWDAMRLVTGSTTLLGAWGSTSTTTPTPTDPPPATTDPSKVSTVNVALELLADETVKALGTVSSTASTAKATADEAKALASAAVKPDQLPPVWQADAGPGVIVTDMGGGVMQIAVDMAYVRSQIGSETTPPASTSGNSVGAELLTAAEADLTGGWWDLAGDVEVSASEVTLAGAAQMLVLLRAIPVSPGEQYEIVATSTGGSFELGGDLLLGTAWVKGSGDGSALSSGAPYRFTVPSGVDHWKPTISGIDGQSATVTAVSVKRVV